MRRLREARFRQQFRHRGCGNRIAALTDRGCELLPFLKGDAMLKHVAFPCPHLYGEFLRMRIAVQRGQK